MLKVITQYAHLKKENYIFFIGRLVTAMGSFIWSIISFFMTLTLGYTDAFATFIMGIYSVICLPIAIIGGKLADKYNRKKIIVYFDFISVVFFILASILPFGFHTVIIILIGGLFQNAEGPAYEAIIADFSDTSTREKAETLGYLGNNIGFIVGASLSGILFESNPRLAIILNGIAISISTFLILFFVNMKNRIICDEEKLGVKINSVYEQPIDININIFKVLETIKPVLTIAIISCLIWLPANVYGTILPLKLKTLHGVDGAKIFGFLNSFNAFIVIAFTPILSYILTKITEIPKLFTGFCLYSIGLFFFMITDNTYILFVGMFFSTIGEISTVLGQAPYLSRRVPISHLGRVSSITSVVWSILSTILNFGMSAILFLTNNDYSFVFLVFIIVNVIASIVCISRYWKDKKRFPILYNVEKIKETIQSNDYQLEENDFKY